MSMNQFLRFSNAMKMEFTFFSLAAQWALVSYKQKQKINIVFSYKSTRQLLKCKLLD
jgi:hypothetical protein